MWTFLHYDQANEDYLKSLLIIFYCDWETRVRIKIFHVGGETRIPELTQVPPQIIPGPPACLWEAVQADKLVAAVVLSSDFTITWTQIKEVPAFGHRK